MMISYLKKIWKYKHFLFLLFLVSCPGRAGKGDFEAFFIKLSDAGNSGTALRYYTEGTVGALKSAVRKGIINAGNKAALLPRFNSETAVKILREEISGSSANITVKYIRHPVQNRIGFETAFRFKWESNMWKLDMEREINNLIKRNNSGAESEYLRKKFRGY